MKIELEYRNPFSAQKFGKNYLIIEALGHGAQPAGHKARSKGPKDPPKDGICKILSRLVIIQRRA